MYFCVWSCPFPQQQVCTSQTKHFCVMTKQRSVQTNLRPLDWLCAVKNCAVSCRNEHTQRSQTGAEKNLHKKIMFDHTHQMWLTSEWKRVRCKWWALWLRSMAASYIALRANPGRLAFVENASIWRNSSHKSVAAWFPRCKCSKAGTANDPPARHRANELIIWCTCISIALSRHSVSQSALG